MNLSRKKFKLWEFMVQQLLDLDFLPVFKSQVRVQLDQKLLFVQMDKPTLESEEALAKIRHNFMKKQLILQKKKEFQSVFSV